MRPTRKAPTIPTSQRTSAVGKTAAQVQDQISTHVGKVGGNDFFIKDKTPEIHGAGTVADNQKWQASTAAELIERPGRHNRGPLRRGNQATSSYSTACTSDSCGPAPAS